MKFSKSICCFRNMIYDLINERIFETLLNKKTNSCTGHGLSLTLCFSFEALLVEKNIFCAEFPGH